MSGLHIKQNCILVDLSETDCVIYIFSRLVLNCCDLNCEVCKDDLTFRGSQLSAATCVCHIELYLTHVRIRVR